MQGVPLILWPLNMSDQSVVAANLSERDVAFELMQVCHLFLPFDFCIRNRGWEREEIY